MNTLTWENHTVGIKMPGFLLQSVPSFRSDWKWPIEKNSHLGQIGPFHVWWTGQNRRPSQIGPFLCLSDFVCVSQRSGHSVDTVDVWTKPPQQTIDSCQQSYSFGHSFFSFHFELGKMLFDRQLVTISIHSQTNVKIILKKNRIKKWTVESVCMWMVWPR